MGELLIQLDRELEPFRRAIRPFSRYLAPRLTVERRVHFDSVEVLRVERQLVEPAGARANRRIDHAVPRTAAARVVPPARADAKMPPLSHPPESLFCLLTF